MNQTPATGYDWLSTGGAYTIIGLAMFFSALFFSVLGMQIGKRTQSESDGCLLSICSILLAFTGGGVGLFIGLKTIGYPMFVATSLVGSILFPAIGSAVLGSKMKRHR